MGMCSEWHYTTREIGGWRHDNEPVRASCHVSIRQSKLNKKVMNGTTMWSCDTELGTNGVEATKCWVFIAHFSIYSTSRCRCHAGTDIPRLRGHTRQIQVVRIVRHRIFCCAPTIHWKCDAQIPNRQIKSPPALWKHVILMSWSYRCFEWQEG